MCGPVRIGSGAQIVDESAVMVDLGKPEPRFVPLPAIDSEALHIWGVFGRAVRGNANIASLQMHHGGGKERAAEHQNIRARQFRIHP